MWYNVQNLCVWKLNLEKRNKSELSDKTAIQQRHQKAYSGSSSSNSVQLNRAKHTNIAFYKTTNFISTTHNCNVYLRPRKHARSHRHTNTHEHMRALTRAKWIAKLCSVDTQNARFFACAQYIQTANVLGKPSDTQRATSDFSIFIIRLDA